MHGPLKRETLGQSTLVLLAAVDIEPGAAEALGRRRCGGAYFVTCA